MQRSTGKELAVRKDELTGLLAEAIEHDKQCDAARRSVDLGKELAMFHAWQAGIRLNKVKAIVGHGNWEDWVEENFCKRISKSISTAQLYMRIDNQNPDARNVKKPKTQHVRSLKFDTIRKYAISFVPDKEQPEHKGNVKFPRLASFLNIVNEYSKIKQRHVEKLQLVDFEEVREETAELYQFLKWIHRDADRNPWAQPTPT